MDCVIDRDTLCCQRCLRPAISHDVRRNCRLGDQISLQRGPGSELKKLLSMIGIQATPNCSCDKRVAVMDARGPDWCEQNIDEIIDWLRDEAGKRKLPFVDVAGRLLIRRAISNARRKT